jgi:CpeT/CpcT family (DUF1001)
MKSSHLYSITTTLSLLLFVLFGSAQNKLSQKDLKWLASTMAGEFSSKKQSEADSAYFHIMLRMKPIWESRTDGYWFYVEQSVASAQDKPYRQRIYHLFLEGDSVAVSQVYELPNPIRFAGAWNDVNKLNEISTESLVNRAGCAIYLRKKGKNHFSGSTPYKECLSSLRGATYATSEVEIKKNLIESWDRGWNAEDKQVWGAEKGAYLFIKKRKLK